MRQGLPQLAQPGVPDLGQATGFGQPLQRIGHTGWHECTRKPGGRGQPAPDQSSRQHGSQHRPQLPPMGLSGQADTARQRLCAGSASLQVHQPLPRISHGRQQVQPDRLPRLPVAGDLQDAGPREPTMREQQILMKHDGTGRLSLSLAFLLRTLPCPGRVRHECLGVGSCLRPGSALPETSVRPGSALPAVTCLSRHHRNRHRQGHAREGSEVLPGRRRDREGNQPGARRHRGHAPLASQLPGPIAGPDGRNGKPARGHDQMPGQEHPIRGAHTKARAVVGSVQTRDLLHGHRLAYLHPATRAVDQQHVNDPLTGIVTEELPQMLFMKADARFTHAGNEALGRVSLECVTNEARIAAQVAGRVRPIQIGEVAATASRDADLLADATCMVQHGHLQAAQPQLPGAIQPGSARAHHDHIPSFHCPVLIVLRRATCTAYGRGARQRIILPTRFGRSRHTREPPARQAPLPSPCA